MSVCECYHFAYTPHSQVGVCWGTKECEQCSCGGDRLKCDFYEEVRNVAKREKEQADSKVFRGDFQQYAIVKDGTYVVKDGVLYELVPKVTYYPGAAMYNVLTGETHYQTNYARVVNMPPKELARWVVDEGRKFGEEYEGYMSLLDWLNEEEDHDEHT